LGRIDAKTLQLQFLIEITVLPSFKEIESKLRPKSNAKEIFHTNTSIYNNTYVNIFDSGSGSHEKWTFFGPLSQGHFLENLTGLNSDFSKSIR